MKKVIAMLFATMAIAMSFTSCKQEPAKAIEGDWAISSVSMMGQSYTVDEFIALAKTYGQDVSCLKSTYMTFKNGKVSTSSTCTGSDFASVDGTYTVVDHTITITDSTGGAVTLTLSDDNKQLTSTTSTSTVVFVKK